jgi:hypothetical protein
MLVQDIIGLCRIIASIVILKTHLRGILLKYISMFLAFYLTTGFAHAEECPARKAGAGYTNSENVNLRAAPGSSATLLRSLALGTQFKVVGKNDVCSTIGRQTGRWINVRILDEDQAQDGWVFDPYITYQDDSPEFIAAFDVYKGSLPKALGPVWVGLAKTASGYELKQYSLRIKKSRERGIEDLPLYHIATVPTGDLVFLVKGLSNIKLGRVVAAQPVSKSMLVWQKNQFALSLGSEKYRFSTGCVERSRRADDIASKTNKYYSCDLEIKGPANSSFSIKNADGEAQSTSVWRPYSSITELVWAGDLDGDGKLDFLLEEELDKSESRHTLFLSSLAPPKKIAREAASVTYSWD